MNPSNEATLGVVLDAARVPAGTVADGGAVSVIGYVWEPATELVAVDGAGAVWSYPRNGGRRVPMNSSVESLRRFLDLFGEFFAATATEDASPSSLSAEEMAAKLAAFARGEIRPKVAAKPVNRKALVKQLKKELKEIDKAAVKAGWWSIILEQVDDEIL